MPQRLQEGKGVGDRRDRGRGQQLAIARRAFGPRCRSPWRNAAFGDDFRAASSRAEQAPRRAADRFGPASPALGIPNDGTPTSDAPGAGRSGWVRFAAGLPISGVLTYRSFSFVIVLATLQRSVACDAARRDWAIYARFAGIDIRGNLLATRTAPLLALVRGAGPAVLGGSTVKSV
jgi:hypothetical protein